MDDTGELSASDVLVLEVVREDGPLPRREIDDQVPVADRTVGKSLQRLREAGLVERRPNPRDARGYVYEPR